MDRTAEHEAPKETLEVFESLSTQIAQARREMGEQRWNELNKEWDV